MRPGRLDPPAPSRRWSRRARGGACARLLPPLLGLLTLSLATGAPDTVGLGRTARATPGYAQAEVLIHGQAIRVDVADTPDKQALGLGGRARLGPQEGMLFVYAERNRQAFWMHGMRIPIDIVWLDNQTVVHIAASVPPPAPGTSDAQLPTYQPAAPANFVLELAAGRAHSLGLRVGDRVRFRFDVR